MSVRFQTLVRFKLHTLVLEGLPLVLTCTVFRVWRRHYFRKNCIRGITIGNFQDNFGQYLRNLLLEIQSQLKDDENRSIFTPLMNNYAILHALE